MVTIGTVFPESDGQVVRSPHEVRLPDGVKQVSVRVKGPELILSPVGQSWDSFFLRGPHMSDDFLPERADQEQPERRGS
jgi:antitoxin VapB